MGDQIELAAVRAITAMRENLSEQITVDDMARAAMFSKFHFTRIFQRATGVSPGRFLSALRLQRAKHLLVSTSLNVADISLSVGYNSVGTFSSRFSRSVGMSPTTFRRMRGYAANMPTVVPPALGQSSRMNGHIWSTRPESGPVFVGLFPDRIPEGKPARHAVVTVPGVFHLGSVPSGTWFVLAHTIPTGFDDSGPTGVAVNSGALVATAGPLSIPKDTVVSVDLKLRPIRALDPPMLLALMDVRKTAAYLAGPLRRPGVVAPSVRAADLSAA